MAMRETLKNLLTRLIKAGMIEWATHDQRFYQGLTPRRCAHKFRCVSDDIDVRHLRQFMSKTHERLRVEVESAWTDDCSGLVFCCR